MPFVVEFGSKQYTVIPGQKFVVDRMDQYQVDQVLDTVAIYSYGDEAGKKVNIKVVAHQKGKKIRVVKYKAKSNYHRQYGYRHFETILEVLGENSESVKAPKKAVAPAPLPKTKKVKTVSKSVLEVKEGVTETQAVSEIMEASKVNEEQEVKSFISESEINVVDDLTKIEGIGPKINELMHSAGINTFSDLANASVETLSEILANGGSNFSQHKPTTWAQQSALARDGEWEELQTLQDELMGGIVK